MGREEESGGGGTLKMEREERLATLLERVREITQASRDAEGTFPRRVQLDFPKTSADEQRHGPYFIYGVLGLSKNTDFSRYPLPWCFPIAGWSNRQHAIVNSLAL